MNARVDAELHGYFDQSSTMHFVYQLGQLFIESENLSDRVANLDQVTDQSGYIPPLHKHSKPHLPADNDNPPWRWLLDLVRLAFFSYSTPKSAMM